MDHYLTTLWNSAEGILIDDGGVVCLRDAEVFLVQIHQLHLVVGDLLLVGALEHEGDGVGLVLRLHHLPLHPHQCVCKLCSLCCLIDPGPWDSESMLVTMFNTLAHSSLLACSYVCLFPKLVRSLQLNNLP
jgi:hypothetical protein